LLDYYLDSREVTTFELLRNLLIAGGRPSTSVNGDIAIQWEWSNFDPSQNQNPSTDYDKALQN